MPLDEFTQKLVETKLAEYCDRKNPEEVRNQVRLNFKIVGYKVNLMEMRPSYRDPKFWTEHRIAQFRYDKETRKWTLHAMDCNKRWHLYDPIRPSMDFDDMLKALDRDSTGIFWD